MRGIQCTTSCTRCPVRIVSRAPGWRLAHPQKVFRTRLLAHRSEESRSRPLTNPQATLCAWRPCITRPRLMRSISNGFARQSLRESYTPQRGISLASGRRLTCSYAGSRVPRMASRALITVFFTHIGRRLLRCSREASNVPLAGVSRKAFCAPQYDFSHAPWQRLYPPLGYCPSEQKKSGRVNACRLGYLATVKKRLPMDPNTRVSVRTQK